ncbi:MAG: ACT domain-containing protein [Deltaproteobacteria bacterium]|jgi:acetolactate synthase small subunit|nr:ACT domain-containing protein [Deltaproteobacteria bacterium]
MHKIMCVHVFDRPGVLDQITGIIRRNSVNIQAIASGSVAEGISQITMVFDGHVRLDVLGSRLSEMSCVRGWEKCVPETHIIRELLLARFNERQKHLMEDGMRVISEEGGMTFVEYMAEPPVIDAIFEKLRENNVACARGGVLGLSLGKGEK